MQIEDVTPGGPFERLPLGDLKQWVKRTAYDEDYNTFIKNDFILKENGVPIIVYLKIPDFPSQQFLDVLSRVKYLRGKRTTGTRTYSKIFGNMPRETIRKDYCSSTALAYEDPVGNKLICDYASELTKYYKKYCPQIFDYHRRMVQGNIRPEWVLEDSVFTSGIINKNNPLKYHFDRGNIRNAFSNMICLKKDCDGGHLSIPEFKLGLDISDKSLLIFDGQSLLHGVTPFKLTTSKGYRYTLVYYTLQQMWICQSPAEELERIKKRKTDREKRRYERLITK